MEIVLVEKLALFFRKVMHCYSVAVADTQLVADEEDMTVHGYVVDSYLEQGSLLVVDVDIHIDVDSQDSIVNNHFGDNYPEGNTHIGVDKPDKNKLVVVVLVVDRLVHGILFLDTVVEHRTCKLCSGSDCSEKYWSAANCNSLELAYMQMMGPDTNHHQMECMVVVHQEQNSVELSGLHAT